MTPKRIVAAVAASPLFVALMATAAHAGTYSKH